MNTAVKLCTLAGFVISAGATLALAQGKAHTMYMPPPNSQTAPGVAQVVALDECDPAKFNAALGPDFCKNVALGASTTLSTLFAEAAAGTPDPNWDFEPDAMNIKEGTTLVVSDEGGEPHTFTEVQQFGGGFVTGLNDGQQTIPECVGGFSRVAVAKTRILQGSQLQLPNLSKGDHLFECCIHPWMRVKIHVD
jgi:hypothetical protein